MHFKYLVKKFNDFADFLSNLFDTRLEEGTIRIDKLLDGVQPCPS